MKQFINSKFKLIVILLVLFGLVPKLSVAQGMFIPFGGKTTDVEYCNCSQNWLIKYNKTSSFMPDNLSFQEGVSTLYAYYQIYMSGNEILGITMSPDTCVKGSHCHSVTPTMLIKMVGTSGTGAGSVDNGGGGQTNPKPTSGAGKPPTDGSGGTSTGGGTNNNANLNTSANESANRQALAADGVNVTSSGNCQDCSVKTCTCVGGMSQSAMTDAENVKQQCPSCQVDVTGSTETGHHNGCAGDCFDLQRGSGSGYTQLDSTIQGYDRVTNGTAQGYNCSNSTPCYQNGNSIYYQENRAHWHVQSDYFTSGRRAS